MDVDTISPAVERALCDCTDPVVRTNEDDLMRPDCKRCDRVTAESATVTTVAVSSAADDSRRAPPVLPDPGRKIRSPPADPDAPGWPTNVSLAALPPLCPVRIRRNAACEPNPTV